MSRKAGINYKFESGVSAAVGPKNSGRSAERHMWQTYHNPKNPMGCG